MGSNLLFKYLGRGCGTFKDFTCKKLGNVESAKSLPFFWHSQYEYLCSDKGEVLVDNIVKFENMSDTIEKIFMKLGFSEPRYPIETEVKISRQKEKAIPFMQAIRIFIVKKQKQSSKGFIRTYRAVWIHIRTIEK